MINIGNNTPSSIDTINNTGNKKENVTIKKDVVEDVKMKSIDFSNLLISIIALLVAIGSAIYSFDQTKSLFRYQNIPSVVVTQNNSGNNSPIVLWNAGPGAAYDVSIEVHFADNIGNVGMPWVFDVIDAAIQLETKSNDELYSWRMSSEAVTNYTSNQITVLPCGKDYGCQTTAFKTPALEGLYIVIRYKNILGEPYYSIWDGYKFMRGKGQPSVSLPKYKTIAGTAVELLWQHIFTEKPCDELSYGYFQRLMKEAMVLKDNGYGDIPTKLNEINHKYKCGEYSERMAKYQKSIEQRKQKNL
jgi:hypothetical protein